MTFRYMLRNRLQNFSTKSSAILNANNIQVSFCRNVFIINDFILGLFGQRCGTSQLAGRKEQQISFLFSKVIVYL